MAKWVARWQTKRPLATLDEIDTVVVNKPLPDEWKEAFQANNVEIIQPDN